MVGLKRGHQHVHDPAQRIEPFQGRVVAATRYPHPAAVRTAQLVQFEHHLGMRLKPRLHHLATPTGGLSPQVEEQIPELAQR
jgi:hypothetical protein